MVRNFDIDKKMFKGQFHERYQFSLDYKENCFKGIYYKGDITWFQPHPLNELEEEKLTDVEKEVYKRLKI